MKSGLSPSLYSPVMETNDHQVSRNVVPIEDWAILLCCSVSLNQDLRHVIHTAGRLRFCLEIRDDYCVLFPHLRRCTNFSAF